MNYEKYVSKNQPLHGQSENVFLTIGIIKLLLTNLETHYIHVSVADIQHSASSPLHANKHVNNNKQLIKKTKEIT